MVDDNDTAKLEANMKEIFTKARFEPVSGPRQVRRKWRRPPSARNGMQTKLLVELIPTGDVVSVTIVESSGLLEFDRSAEQAVIRSGRFEVPEESRLFEGYFRNFFLLFRPEDLLR